MFDTVYKLDRHPEVSIRYHAARTQEMCAYMERISNNLLL